jgi:hypothetical protein
MTPFTEAIMDQRPLFLLELTALGFFTASVVTVLLSFAAIHYQRTTKVYYTSYSYSQQQRTPAGKRQ